MVQTIKELAESLGVSKQTIQYHLRSLPTKNRQTTDKGTILLDSNDIKLLTAKVTKKSGVFADKDPTNS